VYTPLIEPCIRGDISAGASVMLLTRTVHTLSAYLGVLDSVKVVAHDGDLQSVGLSDVPIST
jgi:hypothetical protein